MRVDGKWRPSVALMAILVTIGCSCCFDRVLATDDQMRLMQSTAGKSSRESDSFAILNDVESSHGSWKSTLADAGGPDTLLRRLFRSVQSQQAAHDADYFPRRAYPPLSWYRQRGIYDSFVHLNFHGRKPRDQLLRNGYRFPDENAFVTLFIVHALIEAGEFMPGLWSELDVTDADLDSTSFLSAVEAIASHRDKNQPEDAAVPVYGFWNQQAATRGDGNDTVAYRCTPVNIFVPLSEAATGLKQLQEQFARVHLDGHFKWVGTAAQLAATFSVVFGIPPDADDTGCNMALGYRLLAQRHRFPQSAQAWLDANSDRDRKLFQFYKQYAYRPFSQEYVERSIDPRTYYWIRGFLHKEARENRTQTALITTWMQSIDQVQHQVWYQRMPFSVNNVDASVTVNGLFGIASALFARPDVYGPLFDTEMQRFFMDNVHLIVFTLENRLVEKYNTLVLLYYPPKFAFYWFVARLTNLLYSGESEVQQAKHLLTDSAVSTLEEAAEALSHAMHDHGVPEILKAAKKDANYHYWDDFLGNGDKRKDNIVPGHEDRVFSTAMALNALIDTYTTRPRQNRGEKQALLKVDPNTPTDVVLAMTQTSQWLIDHADAFPRENAFFSGSIKNGRATPFYFPHNTFKWTNGSSAGVCSQYPNPNAAGGFSNLNKLVAAVSGLIPEETYQEMLKNHICFGGEFPDDLIGADLNCDGCVFPYWSSPALTDSMRLLALAKMNALVY